MRGSRTFERLSAVKGNFIMKNYRLSIFRHGLTKANLEGIYAGAGTDWPLCEEGIDQLKDLREEYRYPSVEAVFTSPLLRCTQTAEILFPGVKQYEVQDLREVHFGEFEGRAAAELIKDENYRKWVDPKTGYTPEGGESGSAFAARTGEVLMKMFEFMIKANIHDAACITHGGVAMSMLAQRALPERPAQMWACDPGCGYQVMCDPTLWMRDGLVEALTIVPHGYGEEAESAGYTILENADDCEQEADDGEIEE